MASVVPRIRARYVSGSEREYKLRSEMKQSKRSKKYPTGRNNARSSDAPNLHQIGASEYALNCPFGEFAAVILHLRSNHCTALGI
jgi:hypothetical protein